MIHKKKSIVTKLVTLVLTVFLGAFSLQAQQMAFTPYEELPNIPKILKPHYNESLPDYAKMLFQFPVNYNEILSAYTSWEKQNPGIKDATSRYFKIWRIAIEPYVAVDGTILVPDVSRIRAEREESVLKAMQMQRVSSAKNANTWTYWGPQETFWFNNNSSSTFVQKPAPWQVNVYCLGVTEKFPNVIYAGTETGFLNKSTDKGKTWSLLAANYSLNGAVYSIAVHPQNPDTAYVSAGGYVHRTINGGLNWGKFGGTFSATKLLIDPKTPSKLFSVGSSGIHVTTNRASTWTQKYTSQCWDIEFKPNTTDTLYAVSETANNLIRVLQSNDGGNTFNPISSFPANITQESGALIAVTPSNPNVLWVAVLSLNTAVTPNIKIPVIYKGTLANGTWTWTSKNIWQATNGQGFYDFVLEVSPKNENVVFAGTTSLFKSNDGSISYTQIGGYGGLFGIHPDIQDMRMMQNGDTWVATDGGVNLSTDEFSNVANFEPLVNGIVGSNFWGFDHGWNEDLIVGGRYHNGNTAISDFYGKKALRMGGGESPTGWVILGKSRTVAFDDSGSGWVLPKTPEGGAESKFIFGKFPNMDKYGGLRSNILTHSNYSGQLIVACDSTLWLSKDYGISHEVLYKFTNGRIRWIVNSYSNPDVIYADILGAGFYRSNDGGTTWTKTASVGAPSWNGQMTVSVSPYNANVLYATKQNFNKDYSYVPVMKSTDGGETWVSWSSFNRPIKVILVQPTTSGKDLVYVALNSLNGQLAGCAYRKDGDAAWTFYSTGLPVDFNIQAATAFFRDSKLRFAGTAGVWEAPMVEPEFSPIITPFVGKKVYTCTLDTVEFDDHSMINHQGVSWKWEITPAPSYISNVNIRNPKAVFNTAGFYSVKVTVTKNGVDYVKEIPNFFEVKGCPSVNDCSNPGDVPKNNWRLLGADSYQVGNEPSLAFDGSVNTIWHTSWSASAPAYPHFISIDLGRNYLLSKITYFPRTSGTNGRVKDFELYVSNSSTNWGSPVTTGTMTNTSAPTTFTFAPTAGQYVKFVALSEVNSNIWASCAELSFTGCYNSTGIHDIADEFNVKAFPIPTANTLSISIPTASDNTCNYSIYASNGAKIASEKVKANNQTISINVSSLQSGYYYIFITDINGAAYKAKFMKK